MDSHNIFVGRQPIYNPNLGVFAYELLFRADKDINSSHAALSGDSATSQVILNTFFEMGLENVVGKQFACINLGENYNLWKEIPHIEPERIILDLPQNLKVNKESIAAVKALKDNGYTLALNDFSNESSMRELLDCINIIRLDVLSLGLNGIRRNLKHNKKKSFSLLADKVENLDDFDELVNLGFDYFQGYFLSHPKIVSSKSLPNNKLSIMDLIATLNNEETEVDDIEKVIDRDAQLSYKLLKLINSAGFGLRAQVDSMRHAITMLGKQQLASWASLMALGSLNDRPPEMIHLCMIRAKTCELLAETAGIKTTNRYFTVGLLSALDIIMERKLSTILKPLPLAEDVLNALLYHQGILGEALKSALAFELSEWDKVSFQKLEKIQLVKVNLQAFKWANEIASSLK